MQHIDSKKDVSDSSGQLEVYNTKVSKLLDQVNSTDNKGSFLVKIQNYIAEINELNESVEGFEVLLEQLEEKKKEVEDIISQNRARNLEIKKALLEELKILVEAKDKGKALTELKDLKQRWIKTGDVATEYKNEIDGTYSKLCEGFYSELNATLEDNKKDYLELIERSKEIVEKSKPAEKAATKELIKIQKQWKSLGRLPAKVYKPLWNDFSNIHDSFFKKSKEKEAEKNLEESIDGRNELILEVESLYTKMDSVTFELITELRKKWRSLPFQKEEEEEKLYDEFNYKLEKLSELKKLFILEQKLRKSNVNSDEKINQEKIKLLQRLIRKEEQNLDRMNDNLGTFRINPKSTGLKKMMKAKTNRKSVSLKVKKDLIKSLKKVL